MSRRIDVDQNEDHISGNFEWERKPECSCGMLNDAIEDKFIFISNIVAGKGSERTNLFYILPVTSDGELIRHDGVVISNCPWCGDRILGYKKCKSQE